METHYKTILNFSDCHQIAFTDGSCNPNNKSKVSRGGYSVLFVSGFFKNTKIYGNLDIQKYNASNIRAEGVAILRTLEYINKCNKEWKKLTIITDCEFWINMIEIYMPKWSSDKFDKKANADLTKEIWLVYNNLLKKGEICFMHVKSHNKDGWQQYAENTFEKFCYDKNEEVDKLCKYARLNIKIGNEITT
jgi:ribonuclease HI